MCRFRNVANRLCRQQSRVTCRNAGVYLPYLWSAAGIMASFTGSKPPKDNYTSIPLEFILSLTAGLSIRL